MKKTARKVDLACSYMLQGLELQAPNNSNSNNLTKKKLTLVIQHPFPISPTCNPPAFCDLWSHPRNDLWPQIPTKDKKERNA